MTRIKGLDELLKRLPKSDKEIIQEAKTERLNELYEIIGAELQKRYRPVLNRKEASEYFKDLFKLMINDSENPLSDSDVDDLQNYIFNKIIPKIPE